MERLEIALNSIIGRLTPLKMNSLSTVRLEKAEWEICAKTTLSNITDSKWDCPSWKVFSSRNGMRLMFLNIRFFIKKFSRDGIIFISLIFLKTNDLSGAVSLGAVTRFARISRQSATTREPKSAGMKISSINKTCNSKRTEKIICCSTFRFFFYPLN